jgi:hypothetical protein
MQKVAALTIFTLGVIEESHTGFSFILAIIIVILSQLM